MKLLKYISSQIITFFFYHPPITTQVSSYTFWALLLFSRYYSFHVSCFFSLAPSLHEKFLVELWRVSLQASGHIYIHTAKHSNKINVEAYVIDFYFIYFRQTDVFHGNLILIGGVTMFFWLFLAQKMMPDFYSACLVRESLHQNYECFIRIESNVANLYTQSLGLEFFDFFLWNKFL